MANPDDGLHLLALDTSSPTARLAVANRAGEILGESEHTAIRHSSNLLALCDQLLKRTGARPDRLFAIACGAGPGSFTGLRVGLALAKGLALPFATPLVMVSSLRALGTDLFRVTAAPITVPCIDAGKGEIHAFMFDPAARAADAAPDPLRLPPQELLAALAAALRALPSGSAGSSAVVLGGPGADRHRPALADALSLTLPGAVLAPPGLGPTAHAIARLALQRLSLGESDDLDAAVPIYGRPPDITRPKARS